MVQMFTYLMLQDGHHDRHSSFTCKKLLLMHNIICQQMVHITHPENTISQLMESIPVNY